ncbi:MAG: hypothetical protein HQL29_01895 [Candidatus Omnitrophica bacterium]|nr:hypothetical protein [Candidatus Omnitrophota bacterium]
MDKKTNKEIADEIMSTNIIMWAGNEFYGYWNGHFNLMAEESMKRLIMDNVGNSYSKSRAGEVMDIIKATNYIPVDYLNKGDYINLDNGIYNLKQKKLLSHSPDCYSTVQLPIKYDPKAECPRWIQFLDEVFDGDRDRIDLLQQIYGYCLTRSNKHHVAFFFEGPGATGKSTAAEVLKMLVGDANVSAVSLEQLNNNHYVAMLHGKQLNIVVETKANGKIDDARFKAIVSGDPIQADNKFQPPFMFKPFCKMLYVTNNMPRVSDTSDGFYRRLVIIKFYKQFSEKERDRDLMEKLRKEKDGIFIWALEGLDKLEKKGHFVMPKQVIDEVDKYRKENTHVINFVEDKCETGLKHSVTKDSLYEQYQVWSEKSGHKSLGKINFGKQLQQIYRDIEGEKKAEGWYWIGIRVLDQT